jgi:hypothetical protein
MEGKPSLGISIIFLKKSIYKRTSSNYKVNLRQRETPLEFSKCRKMGET